MKKWSQETIDMEAELDRVKKVAGVFADLIIEKHIEWRKSGKDYTAESLVKGTKYEKAVIVTDETIIYKSPTRTYVWLYIPRDEDETANLIEFSGFK